MRAPMPKTYRLLLVRAPDENGHGAGVVAEMEDTGYFMSRELKRLAKQINEPAPIIPVKGQTEMDLP